MAGPERDGQGSPVSRLFIAIPAIVCGVLMLVFETDGGTALLAMISGIGLLAGGVLALAATLMEMAGAARARANGGTAVDDLAAELIRRAGARAQDGDLDGAARAYEKVVDGPPTRHLRMAVIGRASIAMRQQRIEDARAFFTRLAGSGDPERATLGRTYLAIFAVADGDVTEEGLPTLREAAAAGDPFAATLQAAIEDGIRRDRER